MQETTNFLASNSVLKSEYNVTTNKLETQILDFSKSTDEFENHLATVENYIEKYLPISI